MIRMYLSWRFFALAGGDWKVERVTKVNDSSSTCHAKL